MDNGKWHVDEKIKFINPYNFVPLEGNCKRDEAEKGKLSGVIECSLIPKTDIFIPNTSNEVAFGNFKVENHKSYEFFSYKDLTGMNCTNSKGPENPVITGSEIRGVIRNAYETVTNSCLSTLNTKKVLSTRSVNAKKAGVIFKENGHWVLKKAKKYMLKTSYCSADNGKLYEKKFENGEVYIEACEKKYKTGDVINFIPFISKKNCNKKTVLKICNSSEEGIKKGYLLLGEDFGEKKHYDSIFVLENDEKKNVDKGKIVDEAIEKLKISLNEFYRNEGVNKEYKKGHNGYPDMKIKEDTPITIWYEEIGENIYLSPACVGRNIYYNTLKSLTKTYSPCTSKSNLCSGCNVFGMVSEEDDKEAKASKVRFTDAKLSDNSKAEYTNITTIKELASPKISSVEFYTDVHENYKNSYSYWNYDYYVIYGEKKELLGDSLDLRGRKFYWHHKGNYTEKKVTERNITIRALKANDNTIFNFKVYFEKLTEEELKRLLFTLSIGANDGNGCYKIGTGKPLGLGSVKIKVDNVKLRKLNIENGKILYKIEDTKEFEEYYLNVTREYYEKDNKELEIENICEKMGFNKNTIKAFMKLTDFNAIAQNQTVSYPIGEDKTSSNEMKDSTANWFIGNRKTETSETKPKFNKILPKATDENLELSKMFYK